MLDCQHGDVKPDNWVLTTGVVGEDAIGGVDIKLIDFAQAQKLERLNSVLTGKYAGDESMRCLAMRLDPPKQWGVDFDFFGLCASSHILLFREHIKCHVVECNNTGKQLMKMNGKNRHELWMDYFEKLLHFDPTCMNYCLDKLCDEFGEWVLKNESNVEKGLKALRNNAVV